MRHLPEFKSVALGNLVLDRDELKACKCARTRRESLRKLQCWAEYERQMGVVPEDQIQKCIGFIEQII